MSDCAPSIALMESLSSQGWGKEKAGRKSTSFLALPVGACAKSNRKMELLYDIVFPQFTRQQDTFESS